nr:MAG TPA: helix-turn-helix domain protein [Caudoviricetes sp.]
MNKIKYLREKKGLTQAELGQILSVQKSAISKYELGKVSPNIEVLRKLSNLFHVSIDDLLNNEITKEDADESRADFDSYLNQVKIIYQGAAMKLTDEDRELLRQSFGATYKAILQAKKLKNQKEGTAHGKEADD